MKEQMSGDQVDLRQLENLKNELESRRVDAWQLQRIVEKINNAMPHFRSAMGGESDHAELAIGQLIAERDTLRAACKDALLMVDNLRKSTGGAIEGSICWSLRTALDGLYEKEAV